MHVLIRNYRFRMRTNYIFEKSSFYDDNTVRNPQGPGKSSDQHGKTGAQRCRPNLNLVERVADPPVMIQTINKTDLLSSKSSPEEITPLSSVIPSTVVNQKGFSLVELLIVIGLSGILTLIAIPNIGSIVNNSRLKGAARIVWGDLQNAKMTAIKTNASVSVTFNTNTDYSYPKGGGTTFTRNLATEYPNITVTNSGGGTITFGSTGVTSNATVTIQGASASKTISVYGTGRVIIN
ncbi:MAG: hypothetical protein C0407_02130 [Desulfobacca sp.]|nr:hypothetical protein [Desulfobacca sp.]